MQISSSPILDPHGPSSDPCVSSFSLNRSLQPTSVETISPPWPRPTTECFILLGLDHTFNWFQYLSCDSIFFSVTCFCNIAIWPIYFSPLGFVSPAKGSVYPQIQQPPIQQSDRLSWPLAKFADYECYSTRNATHSALASSTSLVALVICLYPLASFGTLCKFFLKALKFFSSCSNWRAYLVFWGY